MRNRLRAIDPIVLAGLLLAGLEVLCLAPSVHIHDAGELTAAAWTLGLGHPPGSPLYMLLAKIFMTLIPFGHIAWRANLFSALFSVGTFFLPAFWARRRGLPSPESIFVGSFAVLVPTLWSQALMAEVYTLQAFLLAAVFISLDEDRKPEIVVILWGLLLACHVSLAPLSPLLLLLLALPAPNFRETLTRVTRLGLFMVLPLLLYAYIPLRALAAPAIDWSHPTSLREIWWYLTNANVRARSFSLGLGAYLSRSLDFGKILLWNLHLGIPLLLLGSALKKRRKTVLFAWMILLAEAGFVILLDTAPLESEAYGIASIVAAAVLVGLGLEKLGQAPRFRRGLIAAAAISIILVLRFGPFPFNLSSSFLVRDTAEAILSQSPPDAVLLTQEDNTTFPLAYLVEVEGARPDLEIYDRAGNLFAAPYDRPLFRVEGKLAEYRRRHEEGMIHDFLDEGKKVIFTGPFLEYEPATWRLAASGTVAWALLQQNALPQESFVIPEPRAPTRPGWMSRQILAMDHIKGATADLEEGKTIRAVVRLQEAEKLTDMAEIEILIAQLALGADQLELAEKAAQSATLMQARMDLGWQLRAQVAMLKGDLEEAEDLCQHSLRLNPDLAEARLTAGMIAVRRKDWRVAETEFSHAIEANLRGDTGFIDRALVRERRGNISGALEDLLEAERRSPHGQALPLRIVLSARNGRPREEILSALCKLSSTIKAAELDPTRIQRILLISAHAGAPDCISKWIQPLLSSPEPEERNLAESYLRGTNARGKE